MTWWLIQPPLGFLHGLPLKLSNHLGLRCVADTFPAGPPNYFPNARYDVSRDDQRFITYRISEAGERVDATELIVVENFFEELKEKVGGN